MTMDEATLKLISRIGKTSDGKDFVDMLKWMQERNYSDILKTDRSTRDEQVGFGLCLEELVGLFSECDIRLARMKEVDAPDRI